MSATSNQEHAISADTVMAVLEGIHAEVAELGMGEVASYIPELAEVDPALFGIAVCSAAGNVRTVGDADVEFSLQSVTKAFSYALAIEDNGLDFVLQRVGAEPSGEPFNAIRLDPTGRPPNPMVNAGAIVTTSLVHGADARERFERIAQFLGAAAGRSLSANDAVYRSEVLTGDRNRALGFLMRSAESLVADVDETLDAYFLQCAIEATARDVAVMGATLANGGVNPVTGVRVMTERTCENVVTVMASCGMYDFSGEWLLRVGLPAKSGVGGGLLASSPAEFGIGIFSPPLDENGNSVRAIAAARALAERFDLHIMHRGAPRTLSAR